MGRALWKRLPFPLDSLLESAPRNVFYCFHQVQQERPQLFLARGEPHTTVAGGPHETR